MRKATLPPAGRADRNASDRPRALGGSRAGCGRFRAVAEPLRPGRGYDMPCYFFFFLLLVLGAESLEDCSIAPTFTR